MVNSSENTETSESCLLNITLKILLENLTPFFKTHINIYMLYIHTCTQGTASSYIQSMFKRVQSKQYRLRSTSTKEVQFEVPRNRTKMANRSLAVVGSRWWNNLPLDLKTVNTENMFGKRLKTFLFQKFYD